MVDPLAERLRLSSCASWWRTWLWRWTTQQSKEQHCCLQAGCQAHREEASVWVGVPSHTTLSVSALWLCMSLWFDSSKTIPFQYMIVFVWMKLELSKLCAMLPNQNRYCRQFNPEIQIVLVCIGCRCWESTGSFALTWSAKHWGRAVPGRQTPVARQTKGRCSVRRRMTAAWLCVRFPQLEGRQPSASPCTGAAKDSFLCGASS